MLVRGDSGFYGNDGESTGSITITNSSLEEVVFDMEFDIQNLSSGEEGTIDLSGVLKF